MSGLDAVREALPDEAKDIRLNLDTVMESPSLTVQQRWMVALASALASGSPELSRQVQEATLRHASRAAAEDARAAAVLMAMNNVYYRFKHVVEKPAYETMPARLRMNRLAKPATNKADFELACLAVSAINDCEACVRAHENAVVSAGLSAEAVHDAIRIAATMHAAAVGLQAAEVPLPAVMPEEAAG